MKIFLTEMGQILGKIEEETDVAYYISNPVLLNPGNGQVMMFPLLAFTEETGLWIQKKDVKFHGKNGVGLEPVLEIRNHYNGQFGSGIQVATKL